MARDMHRKTPASGIRPYSILPSVPAQLAFISSRYGSLDPLPSPLHITLTMDPFSQPPLESHMLAIAAFVLFTKHISRWESIYLTLPADALLSTFCATALVAPAASILRSVHISLGNWFGNGEVVRSLLAHSPALKELHWSSRRIPGAFDTNCANGIDSLIHNGSWQHITRLALNTLLTLRAYFPYSSRRSAWSTSNLDALVDAPWTALTPRSSA